jgi:hypothetical protein
MSEEDSNGIKIDVGQVINVSQESKALAEKEKDGANTAFKGNWTLTLLFLTFNLTKCPMSGSQTNQQLTPPTSLPQF